MSLKKVKYPLILIALTLLIAVLAVPAMAENEYREVKLKDSIHPDKPDWLIEFTMPIDADSLENNIYIQKEVDQTIHKTKLELGADKKRVKIISNEPYAYNSTYRLYLDEGIRTEATPSTHLTQKTVIIFTTIKDDSLPNISLNVKDNEVIKGKDDRHTFRLEGNLDKPALIKINGEEVKVTNLKFSKDIELKVGKNNIEIIATDVNNRQVKKVINLNYEISSMPVGGGGPSIPGGGENKTELDLETVNNLKEVSTKLNMVIANLKTVEEIDIAKSIKLNIDKKLADNTYDPTTEAFRVHDMYKNLTAEQQESLKDSILYYIPIDKLLQLAEFFGFV